MVNREAAPGSPKLPRRTTRFVDPPSSAGLVTMFPHGAAACPSLGLAGLLVLAVVAGMMGATVCVALAADPQPSQYGEDALQRSEKKDHASAAVQLKDAGLGINRTPLA